MIKNSKLLYETIIHDISKIVKYHLNEVSQETAQSAYDKAIQLSNDPKISKYERFYRKHQLDIFKNYLNNIDKNNVNNVFNDIKDSNIGDIILFDKKTYFIFSITPELYKENKALLNNYIAIGMCINNDSEITVMANTTIKNESDRYNYLTITSTYFKISSYNSRMFCKNEGNNYTTWKSPTFKDLNYIKQNYDIIKDAIKLTNVCKFNKYETYIGIDEKEQYEQKYYSFSDEYEKIKKYPYYDFYKNEINWEKLHSIAYIRPIIHYSKN